MALVKDVKYEGDNDNIDYVKSIEEKKFKLKSAYLDKLRKRESELTIKETQTLNKKLEKLHENLNKKQLEEDKKLYRELENEASGYFAKLANKIKQTFTTAEGVAKITNTVAKTFSSGMSDYMGSFSKYMSGIETRLQGSDKTFTQMTDLIKTNIGASPLVSQTQVLQNLNTLVSQGIAYNVEQRAFLATVSDKIATTFDAANGTLLQLIRIQGADTTAARLGLESSLTKYFNQMFGDTSYLSTTFDTVSDILLGSTSQLSSQQSVAYEYAIQKWLGSLGSIGVSSSTLQSLAQGLNYLGTGNISALSSNAALQRLFVSAAGSSYSDILTSGLSAEGANAILSNVVSIAQQIGSIQNNVLRQQYATMFGFELSDLTAIAQLTAEDLKSIAGTMLDYTSLYNETVSQLQTFGSRMSVKERVDTLMENIMATTGETIASNIATYSTWVIADVLEKTVGGINISLPFGTNLNVSNIMKTGLVGYGILANLGALGKAFNWSGGFSLGEAWNATDTTTRGGTSLATIGVSTGISGSTYLGNISESDIYSGSLASTEQQNVIAKQEENDDRTLSALEDQIVPTLNNIYSLLRTGVINVRTSSLGGSL